MISVAEALQLVLENVRPLGPRRMPLEQAFGEILTEPVVSDIDSPPHDKSVVDGYAVRYADLADGAAELRILEEITAGLVPRLAIEQGTTSRVMTGAPVPAGADSVVMVERSTPLASDRVRLDDPKAKRGQNIVARASVMRRGDVALPAQTSLTAACVGVAAEAGCTEVTTAARPRAAIVATGNELVDVGVVPQPSQIRNSNGPMLAALCRGCRAEPLELGIARDDVDSLRAKIAAGLEADLLLLSGGVSAGVLDLVPGVLQELGVREVFHKVSVKPGKPVWFGVWSSPTGATKPVFGLPGNPVSTLVCFELFVKPALAALRGIAPTGVAADLPAQLDAPFTHRGDRPTYWPGQFYAPAGNHGPDCVAALPWKGSGDLRTLARANCLIAFAAGTRDYAAGEEVRVLPLR